MSAVEAFEPAKFLTRVNGSEYLEVKWRLVWLRDRHPNAVIETELVSHDAQQGSAIFKATVTLPGGKGLATGYGSETKQDFRDYIEKAESKSIGRALAALGFGTQFCDDHNFGVTQGRVVDAPVPRPRQATPQNGVPLTERVRNGRDATPVQSNGTPQPDSRPIATPGQPATEKQWGFLEKLRNELNLERPQIAKIFSLRYGYDIDNADRADLSNMIDAMQQVRNGDALEGIMTRVAPLETAPAAASVPQGTFSNVPWDDLPPVEPPF